jgi:hypothetical protein
METSRKVGKVIVDTTKPETFIYLGSSGKWLKRMADGSLHVGKDLMIGAAKNSSKSISASGACAIAGAVVFTAGALLYAGYKLVGGKEEVESESGKQEEPQFKPDPYL